MISVNSEVESISTRRCKFACVFGGIIVMRVTIPAFTDEMNGTTLSWLLLVRQSEISIEYVSFYIVLSFYPLVHYLLHVIYFGLPVFCSRGHLLGRLSFNKTKRRFVHTSNLRKHNRHKLSQDPPRKYTGPREVRGDMNILDNF